MKKLSTLLLAALLLPFTMVANQMILGHYTTDDIDLTRGWGMSSLYELTLPIATDLTPEELALFQGSKIVAFRVGLTQEAPVSRVFVMPLDPNDEPTGEVAEWPCNVSSKGWNLIELETPYLINLPTGYKLRIGFDYVQPKRSSKPISAVFAGEIHKTYILRDGVWKDYGINTTHGNLSIQCICENDHFPDFLITNLTSNDIIKLGNDLPFSFMVKNFTSTNIAAGELNFDVAIDGNVVKSISNPTALATDPISIQGQVNTADLAVGTHTLNITTTTIGSTPVENPYSASCIFKVYEFGFERQMRLVEQFTSTGCTFCPQGTANIEALTQMRDDIAWVAIHEYLGGPDPFMSDQTDSIDNFQGIDGYPEASFDRTAGISSANKVWAVISNLPVSTMSSFLDYVAAVPSWATVNVNSTYNPATRNVVITIDGDLAPGYEDFMGTDSKLTVYLTEDGLVAPQVNGGDDYVHNNVMRVALGSVQGVALNKTGDTYKNVFNYTIPREWNTENMHIVAFISRPLGNPVTDIYVTNTNMRKFGESDEPAFVRGDVNDDSKVNIEDVTSLINYLLSGDETGINLNAANCDEADNINIADVTSLIYYLLSGNW